MDWQSMDTAPKDGTKVLVAHPGQYSHAEITIGWFDGDDLTTTYKPWNGNPPFTGMGWCSIETEVEDYDGDISEPHRRIWPTHWQPLPDLPVTLVNSSEQLPHGQSTVRSAA